MSWLYTIIVSSLLASSGVELPFSYSKGENSHNIHASVQVKDETEKFEQSYPISANGTVKVANINGLIVVEAWDRNEVRLEVVKTADTKEDLASVDLKIDSRPDLFSVEADYGQWKWGENRKNRGNSVSIEFKLSVPRTANLNEIETVNGSVTVSNFVNSTKISAVNGNVIASNLRGNALLSTVNGEVKADFDRIEQGTRVNLSTVNGKVNLLLPSDSNATVKADSLNGNITNGFGLPVRKGEYVGRDLYGKIGTGEAQVRLNTVNGELNINRKDDGRTQNPATNLLQTKRGSDRDDDVSVNVNIDSERMNRDIKNAMRDAQRATEDASKDAARALASVRMNDLVKLDNLKVDINEKAIQKAVEQGLKARQDSLVRLRDIAWLGNSPMVARQTNSFNVKGTPKVTINSNSCAVRVRGWDKAEVKYSFTEMPAGRDNSAANVKEDQSGNNIDLTVVESNGMSAFPGSESCRVEVFVPRKANLKIVSEGEIRLEGVSGELDIDGQDESIDVRGSDGKLQIKNADGNVRVIGFVGELIAKTDDGEMLLDGDFSRISAEAIDGKFILTLPTSIDAEIVASNEQASFDGLTAQKMDGNKWRLGSGSRKYSFKTDDGSVEVRSRDLVSVL